MQSVAVPARNFAVATSRARGKFAPSCTCPHGPRRMAARCCTAGEARGAAAIPAIGVAASALAWGSMGMGPPRRPRSLTSRWRDLGRSGHVARSFPRRGRGNPRSVLDYWIKRAAVPVKATVRCIASLAIVVLIAKTHKIFRRPVRNHTYYYTHIYTGILMTVRDYAYDAKLRPLRLTR